MHNMNRKVKKFIYIALIFLFTAIAVMTLLVHFSIINIGDNAVLEIIKGSTGFYCIITPTALMLIILLYKFVAFIKRKKVQTKMFELDTTDNDAFSTQYAVGKFLSSQKKRIEKEAKSAENAAVRSTKILAKTSANVSATLQEHNAFIRTAYNGEADKNKINAKKLEESARPLADKISAAQKYYNN